MAVKRKVINLTVDSNSLTATDADTGLAAADAGVQGEDGAVWLHIAVPDEWGDLSVRLQVLASSGDCDESGLPLAGVIDMPLRSIVTVAGKLTVTLTGTSSDGVRRTAECTSLYVTAGNCPADAVSEVYPLAFENLYNEVATGVVHKITGSGGADVTKTDDTTYNINVSGTGGDMLQSNYVTGSGSANSNTIDHALYADKTGNVDNATHADTADSAASAGSAAAGSALETALNAKQAALKAGGNSGVDLLSGTTVKSLKGSGITVKPDDNSVTLGFDGSLITTGMIMYFAKPMLPSGWQYCDGRQVKISDYSDLYKIIADRYGTGTIDHILVSPQYLTDNSDPADDIVLQKYTDSIQDKSYFAAGGTTFTGDDFKITTAGDYTVYCKDSTGREAVQYVKIPSISAAYLLNLEPYPISDDLKLEVYAETTGETSTVNLVKLASGIQEASYFTSSGTTIGTADQVGYTFQDGTTMASGIYTWYTDDKAGNTAIQYFNVVAEKTLAMYLVISYGSSYFKLPSLVGTINSLLCPCIKT